MSALLVLALVAQPPTLELKPAHPPGVTRCAACHTAKGWSVSRFSHERTGFPLRGKHEAVVCKSCHPASFQTPLPTACGGCHRDAHTGSLGMHCEGCHDEKSWRPFFNADAHRRGNFPLSGRHALIPCVECHRDMRDRSFGRAAVDCFACHRADYQRTAMTSINHVELALPTDCRQCHNTWRFAPASFPQHDQCFRISSGVHSGIRCLSCHTSLPPGIMVTGMCATNTAACTSCHEHTCTKTDQQHAGVAGYQCANRKCYECHRFAAGGG